MTLESMQRILKIHRHFQRGTRFRIRPGVHSFSHSSLFRFDRLIFMSESRCLVTLTDVRTGCGVPSGRNGVSQQCAMPRSAINTPLPRYDNVFGLPPRRAMSAEAQTKSSHSDSEVKEFTKFILNPKRYSFLRSPMLGTMSSVLWEGCFAAMRQWLELSDDDNLAQLIRQKSQAYNGDRLPSGYAVDSADRLLFRLLDEYPSVAFDASSAKILGIQDNHLEDELCRWMMVILEEWHRVGLDFPGNVYSIERSERLVYELVYWAEHPNLSASVQRVMQQTSDQDLIASYVKDIVESWIRQESSEGIRRAAAFLHRATEQFPIRDVDILVSCFRRLLQQSVALGDSEMTSSVLEYMKAKAEDPWYESLQPSDDDNKLAYSILSPDITTPGESARVADLVDDLGHEASHKMSSFEEERWQRRILDAIRSATVDDQSNVESLIQKWNSIETTNPELDSEFAVAVTKYYTAAGLPLLAAPWLLRMSDAPVEVRIECHKDLIRLWGTRSDAEAPWRAGELLESLEKLANDRSDIGSSIYKTVAELWLRSGDSYGTRKVFELCHKVGFNLEMLRMGFASLEERKDPQSKLGLEVLDSAFQALARYWNHLENAGMVKDCIRLLAKAMGRSESTEGSFALLRLMAKKTFVPQSDVCRAILSSFSRDSEPREVKEMLHLVTHSGATIEFGTYRSAIKSLLEIRGNPKVHETLGVYSQLLDALKQGLHFDHSDLDDLIREMVKVFSYVRHDNACLTLVKITEEKLSSSETTGKGYHIPLDCYHAVAVKFFHRNDLPAVEHLFKQAIGYARAGDSSMQPDSSFYHLYMFLLWKRNSVEREVQEKLLKELVDIYRTTRQPQYKPMAMMYTQMFSSLKKSPTRENLDRSLTLLDEALGLQVEFDKAFGFNTIMHHAILVGGGDTLQIVLRLLDLLKDATVPPDIYTFHNVLDACSKAGSNERELALKAALQSFKEMRSSDMLNEHFYLLLFKAIKPDRSSDMSSIEKKIISSMFEFCCKDGFLSEAVRDEVRKLVSSSFWAELYEDRINEQSEPVEWSRKV